MGELSQMEGWWEEEGLCAAENLQNIQTMEKENAIGFLL